MLDNKYANFWVIAPLLLLLLISTVGSSTNRTSLNRHGYDTSRERVDPAAAQQEEAREIACAKANSEWHFTGYLPEGCDRW
jgi:hypothetical protein